MYKRFFRVIMIMILALGMLSGSFVTSMAMAVSDDIQAVNFDAATSAELEEGAAPTSVEESVAPSEENVTPVPTVKDVSTNEEGTKDVDNSQDDNTNNIPQDVEIVDNQKVEVVDNQKKEDSFNNSQENVEHTSEEGPVVEVSSEPVAVVVPLTNNTVNEVAPATPNSDNSDINSNNQEDANNPSAPSTDNPPTQPDEDTSKELENPPVEEEPVSLPDEVQKEGYLNGHPIDPKNIEWVYHKPTCMEDGFFVVTYWCKNKGNGCTRNDSVHGNGYLGEKIYLIENSALGHTHGDPIEENRVEPTCTEAGSYDEVVYCSVCNKELSRDENKVIEALGHTPGEATEENRIEPTDTKDGSYETVVRCTVCGEEISREKHVLPKTGKTDEQKDDKEDDSKTDTIPEVIEEVIEEIGFDDPSFLVIRDGANILMAEVDENGYASFDDVLTILEEGTNASEVITLKVNGISYTFTRYADGRVVGTLPPGFSIEGNVLKVKVLSGKFSISVTSRSATSSIAQEFVEAPEVPGIIAGVFEPGTEDPSSAVTVLPEPAATEEVASPSRRTNTSRTTYAEEETYTTLEEAALSVIDPETKASDTDDKDAASNPILRSSPRYGSELQSEGLLDGSAASKFLIAADIVLTLGLLVGLGILWKLGLFKF